MFLDHLVDGSSEPLQGAEEKERTCSLSFLFLLNSFAREYLIVTHLV